MIRNLENVDCDKTIAEIKEEMEELLKKHSDFWGHIIFQVNFKRGSPLNMNVRAEKSIELK